MPDQSVQVRLSGRDGGTGAYAPRATRPHATRRRAAQLVAPIALASTLAAVLAASAPAETVQHQNLLVTVDGGITPKRLPRIGLAPVAVRVAGRIQTTDGRPPPPLRRFSLDINRHGRLFQRGLPRCRRSELEDATTAQALRSCKDALVGRGHVSAEIVFPDQAPLPAEGELLAFNARRGGRPIVLGHVFGTDPVPVTTVVPFLLGKAPGRTYGTRLTAVLPTVAADWGYVAAFRMRIGRRFWHAGERRSYLRAGCPAPRGLNTALFDLARATYRFEDDRLLSTTIQRDCRARG